MLYFKCPLYATFKVKVQKLNTYRDHTSKQGTVQFISLLSESAGFILAEGPYEKIVNCPFLQVRQSLCATSCKVTTCRLVAAGWLNWEKQQQKPRQCFQKNVLAHWVKAATSIHRSWRIKNDENLHQLLQRKSRAWPHSWQIASETNKRTKWDLVPDEQQNNSRSSWCHTSSPCCVIFCSHKWH